MQHCPGTPALLLASEALGSLTPALGAAMAEGCVYSHLKEIIGQI